MALTAKQQIFVDEYLKTRNATKAAISAGYSEKTAYSIGWENLRKPEIKEIIDQRLAESAMTANEVIELLSQQARGDMSDFVTFKPGVNLPILDMAKANANGKMPLVKKLKYTDQGGIEFELYDKQAALSLLAKYHKLLTDKQEISGQDGGPITHADVSKLTEEELDRVIATGRKNRVG